MLTLKKIAVTGGLSSGKSTVCKIFQQFGAYVMSADEIVHKLLSPKTKIGQQVINLIGSDVVVDQQIDRSKIAKKVFNQPTLLLALEQLLHPAVKEEIDKEYNKVKHTHTTTLFVVEIPLLFEAKMEKDFDVTIAVVASPETSRQRFVKATGAEAGEYAKRASRQLSVHEKAQHADYTIVNEGTLENLTVEVQKIIENLT